MSTGDAPPDALPMSCTAPSDCIDFMPGQKDTDCVAIEEGDFCQSGANNGCANAAINGSALAQYRADLAKTTVGVCYGLSGCLGGFGPVCQNGVCAFSGQSGDAGAE